MYKNKKFCGGLKSILIIVQIVIIKSSVIMICKADIKIKKILR